MLTKNRRLWGQEEHPQQADTVSYPPDIMGDYILSKSYNPLLNREGTSQPNFNKGGIKEFRYWTPQDFASASEKARNSFLKNYQYKLDDWLSDFLLVKEPGGKWVAAQSSPVQLHQVIDIREYGR